MSDQIEMTRDTANQWRDHLSEAERAELAEIDDKAGEIDAERRRITDDRRRAWGKPEVLAALDAQAAVVDAQRRRITGERRRAYDRLRERARNRAARNSTKGG